MVGPWYLRYIPVRNRWVFLITCVQVSAAYVIGVGSMTWYYNKSFFSIPWQVFALCVIAGSMWNAFVTSPALLTITIANADKLGAITNEINMWLGESKYEVAEVYENGRTYHATSGLYASAAYRAVSVVAVETESESLRVRGLPISLYVLQSRLLQKGLIEPVKQVSSLFK